MTPRTVIILAAVTLAFTVAAGISVLGSMNATDPVRIEEPAVPGFAERADEASRLKVDSSAGAVVVERQDGQWLMPDKNGYPVDAEKVGTALRQLAELLLIEPKTKLAKRHSRLQVEDPEAEKAQSRRLTVWNAENEILADLIVGTVRNNLASGVGTYVRKPGDDQAWLARGALDVWPDAAEWLESRLSNVVPERVARVTLEIANGTLEARRPGPEGEIEIRHIPRGKVLDEGSQQIVTNMGKALWKLDLVDVREAAAVEFAGESLSTAEIETFDGLVVRLEMVELDGEIWTRIHAGTVEAAAEDGPAAREAAAINARVEGWAYRLPSYKTAPLRSTRDYLFADAEDSGGS